MAAFIRSRGAIYTVALFSLLSVVIGMLSLPAAAEEAAVSVGAEGWTGRPVPPPSQVPDPISGPISDNVPSGEIAANTLPVGLRNAQPSHQSYLKFDLPSLEPDSFVTSMQLTLTEEGNGAGDPTGVLACLVLADWPAEAGFAWSERPEADPDVCSAGAAAENGTWSFDLGFQASQWLEDGVQNFGIALLPRGNENLPVGQPDPSTTQYLVSFGGVEAENPPVVTLEFEPPLPPFEPEPQPEPEFVPPPPAQAPSQPPPSNTGSSSTNSGGFFSAPTFEPPAGEVAEPAPEVAPPAQDGTAQPQPQPVGAPAAAQEPVTTPAYVWFLIPLGLLGVLVLGRSLTEDAVLVSGREGATTRLLERRRAGGDTSAAPAFQV